MVFVSSSIFTRFVSSSILLALFNQMTNTKCKVVIKTNNNNNYNRRRYYLRRRKERERKEIEWLELSVLMHVANFSAVKSIAVRALNNSDACIPR